MVSFRPVKAASPLVYRKPERYLATGEPFASLDVAAWSAAFEWEQDPLAGVADYLTRPRKTVKRKRGDCEDYAFVVASALLEQDVSPVTLWWMWGIRNGRPTGHTLVADADRSYSNGKLFRKSPETYADDNGYSVTRHKRIGTD
ncbi:MAG: transglutaminase-like domain-containing protein [Halobaculum sp.]